MVADGGTQILYSIYSEIGGGKKKQDMRKTRICIISRNILFSPPEKAFEGAFMYLVQVAISAIVKKVIRRRNYASF